jgi:hypothetical protein
MYREVTKYPGQNGLNMRPVIGTLADGTGHYWVVIDGMRHRK